MTQIHPEATPLSTVARQHAQSEPSLMLPHAAAGRTMPSAEAMTAPRAREHNHPPSPPDRPPSRRGGHPSPSTASAAGRPARLARLASARRGLVRSARVLAAVAWLSLLGALALPVPAQAQTSGICDRTQQVQDEILSGLSAVSDCAAVTVADLATVTELVLEGKSITSLKADDFAGLTAVTSINPSLPRLAVVLRIWAVFGECEACNLLIIKDLVSPETNVVP